MKQILVGLFIVLAGALQAQNNPAMGTRDTIKYSYRTGGDIFGLDINNSYMGTTMPGGPFSREENILPYNFFLNSLGGVRSYLFGSWNAMRFSGIPHLGFSYQFGSQATQYVHVRYTQAFTPKLLLNIDYDMRKANGFYRHSTTADHNVQLRLERQAPIYSFSLKAQYLGRNSQYNQGLISDTLIGRYDLGFIPVNNMDAMVRTKGVRVELEHYIDFLKNDSINATGIYVDNIFRVFNRKMHDNLGDTILYGAPFFGGDSLNDQYQLSEIITGGGLYYNRPNFYIKAGLAHTYWKYFNLGNDNKQNEINVDAKLAYTVQSFEISNHTNFNLIGANREWFTHAKIKAKVKKVGFDASLKLDNLLPEPFQRSFRGQFIGYNYALSDLKNQWKMQIDGNANLTLQNMKMEAFVGFAGMKNVYWYKDGAWAQENNSSLNGMSLGINYTSKFFNWLNIGLKGMYSSAEWMPDIYTRLRVAANGKIFKSKKLFAQIGVEGSYLSNYNLVAFSPLMETYRYENGIGSSLARFNVHVFGALEIQTFRFFFRVENLGSLFNDDKIEVMKGYVIAPVHFRIGITWDFFN